MNRNYIFESETFEFNPQFESDEFGSESQYETTGMSSCPPFTPVSVEKPGGGRVKDKRIPNKSDIVVIQGAYGKTPLHRLTAEALKALVCAARADGIKAPQLLPTGGLSGFRSPKQQESLRSSSEATHGSQNLGKWVAKPGFSAHQSGRAIDFYLGIPNRRSNVEKLKKRAAYKWMVANAQRFGFYPYPAEPWHWEYNPPAAKQSEFLFETGESFEFETGRKCERRDWCAPDYLQWVQKSLNRLGKSGLRLREDGFLDTPTRRAIINFQRQSGLKPDGQAGSLTEKALLSKGASQPPPVKNLSCSPTKTETLIATINKYRGGIPLHILLGWVEVESGRQIGSITSLCERGYFQIHPDEAKDHKISNHHLLSYDEDHSIQSGLKIVNTYIARTNLLVKKYGLPSSGEAYWKVVKLHHWIPSGAGKILADMTARGVAPSNWSAITSHALNPVNRARLKKIIKFDPKQGIDNADKMMEKANAWLEKLNAGKSLNKESFFDENEFFELGSQPVKSTCEQIAPGETLCLNISLGLKTAPTRIDLKTGKPAPGNRFVPVKPLTGIFIPRGFVPRREVDIVLYLHGHKNLKPGSEASMNEYWNGSRFPYFALREEVKSSEQNVVFVAPTLGPLSQAGDLPTAKGFDSFLSKVLAALKQHFAGRNARAEIQNIGKIIIAAHSGGGSPMIRIAELKGSSNVSKIAECWAFDSMYGEGVEGRWANWAASRPNARLFAYYFDTAARSKSLERISQRRKLQNVCVRGWNGQDWKNWEKSHPNLKKTDVGPHYWIPVVYLKERLQNSPCRTPQARFEMSPFNFENETFEDYDRRRTQVDR